jgi:hypothetical protein
VGRISYDERAMPSERAKENKTLTSSCAICGKDFSTELLRGRVEGVGRHRRIVPVCDTCLDKPLEKQEGAADSAAVSPVTDP